MIPLKNKQNNGCKGSVSLCVMLILLCFFMWVGYYLMVNPYPGQTQSKTTIEQEVLTYREKVPVYHPATEPVPEITEVPDNYADLFLSMRTHNQELFESGQKELTGPAAYSFSNYRLRDYGFENETFGVVTIPKLGVEMPLFLGANHSNLNYGFCQMAETSLPIGGPNTNTVIAGHRGWNGLPFLRDIEELEIGDSIFIENPWEIMQYRVSQIDVVEPTNRDSILIQEGKELITLLTCHPYLSRASRYLVYAERVPCDCLDSSNLPKTEQPSGFWDWKWVDRVEIVSSETGDIVESSQVQIFQELLIQRIGFWLCSLCTIIAIFVIFQTIRKKTRKYNDGTCRQNQKEN